MGGLGLFLAANQVENKIRKMLSVWHWMMGNTVRDAFYQIRLCAHKNGCTFSPLAWMESKPLLA